MTIKHQLDQVYKQIRQLDAELDQLKNQARSLERARVNACNHQFGPLHVGYEHEGGTCIHCGINEVYYLHHKR